MSAVADAYAGRVAAVVLARLRGPKARKGTRHWSDRVKDAGPRYQGEGPAHPLHIEVKTVDANYVVPDTLVGEIIEAGRPVALRVARDAAADAARRLGVDVPDTSPGADGMFAVDEELLADLVDEALEDMLGAAGRYADGLRHAILTGDDDGLTLDELVERVGQAAEKGGNWLRLNARSIGVALAGKATLEQAGALGVAYTQWLSRRDGRVRKSHVVADGQIRPIGDGFSVGAFELEYPGDPSGLPETAGEVHNCRCALLLADPDDSFWDGLERIAASVVAGPDSNGAADVLAAALGADTFAPVPDPPTGLPDLAALVTTLADVVGWRLLAAAPDVTPGQVVDLPAGTVLGLVAPEPLTGVTLAVLVPAGTEVGVAGGALVLTGPTAVTVLAAGAAGVQGRTAAP